MTSRILLQLSKWGFPLAGVEGLLSFLCAATDPNHKIPDTLQGDFKTTLMIYQQPGSHIICTLTAYLTVNMVWVCLQDVRGNPCHEMYQG